MTAPSVKWIIVVEGSTDRTAEIVQGYAKRFPLAQPSAVPGSELRSKGRTFNARFSLDGHLLAYFSHIFITDISG
jgi:glycosyltransferase involved in cell wall biosynthesis